MTKQEWMTYVAAKIPEDSDVQMWFVMADEGSETDYLIGQQCTGKDALRGTAEMLKTLANGMKIKPLELAKAALAYDRMKEALKEGADTEDDDDDQ